MNMSSYNCLSKSSKESKQIAFLSSLLKVVSEESHLKILCILHGGEHCVCEIMECVGMSQSLVSHHLSDLKKAGMVVDDKKGLRVYYTLTDKGNVVTKLIFNYIAKEIKK